MQTDFPTVEIFFVFAFTHCRVRVYEGEEDFIREVLVAQEVEFLEPEEAITNFEELDHRVLVNLIREALPEIIKKKFSRAPEDMQF